MSVAPPTEFMDLMDMKLHETRPLNWDSSVYVVTSVIRVPGGLIYMSWPRHDEHVALTSVFVPVAGWDTAYLADFIKQSGLQRKGKK